MFYVWIVYLYFKSNILTKSQTFKLVQFFLGVPKVNKITRFTFKSLFYLIY